MRYRINKKSQLLRQSRQRWLMRQCTIPQHPPTQTIDVTHRHNDAPSSIEPPDYSNPPSSAMHRLPNLSSYLCSSFKIVGVGTFPLDTAGEDAGCSTCPTGCPVSSPSGVRQRPSIALIQGLPSLPFPPSTGLTFNWASTGSQAFHCSDPPLWPEIEHG